MPNRSIVRYDRYMITVLKASGETEPFSEEKLYHSIQRAGIPQPLQQEVINHINSRLHNNITSREIYRHITEYLGKSQEPFSRSRYSLKESVMLLGPTGYPFEDFIASVLEHRGYQVKTRQIIRGKCVTHEIDVIARKNGKTSMIEVKFHNSTGIRTNIHVSMYTKSRFDDVKDRYTFDDAWIITNTKATTDAIAFAECVGMKVFGWDYPKEGSIREAIEEYRLYPVTALVTLSMPQKIRLIQNHVVLCKAICMDHDLLNGLRLTKDQRMNVLSEVNYLCGHKEPEPSFHSPVTPVQHV